MLVLVLFTFFVGSIGISFSQEPIDLDILSKLLIPSIDLLHQNSKNSVDWYEFFTNAIFSVSIAISGLFIAYILYGSAYSFFQNLYLINSFYKESPKKYFFDQVKKKIYSWSYNRGYIDAFYEISLTNGIRGLAQLTYFFDRRVIDGITNGVGITSFFVGEGIKYIGGGRISSYLLLYLFYVLIFLLILIFFFKFI